MQVLLIIEFYLQMSLMHGDDTGNALQRVNGVLDSLNTGTATPDQINSVLDDIGNTLINTASVVFVQKKKENQENQVHVTITGECKTKQDTFHRERVINLRKDKSDINKHYLNNVVKVYMKILNTSYSSYREKCSKYLRSLSKSDTKAFWKTSHKYNNKKDNPDIDLDIFFFQY